MHFKMWSNLVHYFKFSDVFVQVIAEDMGEPTFTSTANVVIRILDTNDHSPVFANETYYAKVPEHCPDRTTVANITVSF